MANERSRGVEIAQMSGSAGAGVRTAGVRPCPSCHTQVSVHATVCPNCGENVAVKEKTVRCRRCRQRASSNLVVCPHCGRDLYPATTRWLTWGMPLLALVLVLALLLGRMLRGDPAQWLQRQSERMTSLVQALSSRLEPEFSVVMIPPEEDPDDPLVSQAIQANAEVQTSAAASSQTGIIAVAAKPTEAPAQEVTAEPAVTTNAPAVTQPPPGDAAAAAEVTATATAEVPTATAAATAAPTLAQPAASATMTSGLTAAAPAMTETPGPTVSLLSILEPTPSATATLAIREVYEVRRGDTLFDIASRYKMSVDDLLAANNLAEDDVYTIQPGDSLNIPAPTPEIAAMATSGPAADTYTVRAGDTLLAIALRLNLSVEDLLAANNMTINDARGLRPGDVLELPGTESVPTPAPTPLATPTAVVAPTAAATTQLTLTPALTQTSTVRFEAPRLRSPQDGAKLNCTAQSTLSWVAVPNLRLADLYLVHLGYVNDISSDGQEEIIWVMTQQRPANTTSWSLDNDLCGLAPSSQGKQWRWYVEVAEKGTDGLQPLSPASTVWGFAWQ